MIVECNWSAFFCPEKMTVPAGQLLADAVRANGWKHVREPGGKSKNYCPAHFPKQWDMRQPNGRMSKKDRRAIQAFGLVPSEDVKPGTTMWGVPGTTLWGDTFLRSMSQQQNPWVRIGVSNGANANIPAFTPVQANQTMQITWNLTITSD